MPRERSPFILIAIQNFIFEFWHSFSFKEAGTLAFLTVEKLENKISLNESSIWTEVSLVFRITFFENIFPGSFQNLFFYRSFLYDNTGSCLTFRDSEIIDVSGGQQGKQSPMGPFCGLNCANYDSCEAAFLWRNWDLGIFMRPNFLQAQLFSLTCQPDFPEVKHGLVFPVLLPLSILLLPKEPLLLG